ncbi:MAG: NACHT domain-containing protein [Coleofasciculus sp. C1-SOL-03]|uniref:NACHT C-terminal alpha/beta 1 domain-containing protein n=1 Tax=Coleofasciculus sp. C1-SOL-03 TaxID=3069522 RepID=UPI0033036146
MSRKISWGESDQTNTLNLVEALQKLAAGELEANPGELNTEVLAQWVSEFKLRVTGKVKRKRGKREQTGTTKKALVKLVEASGKGLELPKRIKESSRSRYERQAEAIQTVIDSLRELEILEEEPSQKNQGYWKFSLNLTHQTKPAENLEKIRHKWQERTGQTLVETKWRSLQVTDEGINWGKICHAMLEKRRRATSNILMQEESAKFEREQIYVPLALVERKKQDKRDREFLPEKGTQLYEPQYQETQRFEHDAFLSQILEKGEGKSQGKQIALIGEPGAGKTTLLQAIAFWLLENNLGLPIWINLADLSGKDIGTYVLEVWLNQAIPPTRLNQKIRDDLVKQIEQGRVWLLLDGVDEMVASTVKLNNARNWGDSSFHSVPLRMTSENPLQAIADQLTGWINQARVVLTCRLNVWLASTNALETFETYCLLDFDYPHQVHQFIDNWFNNCRDVPVERLQPDKAKRLKAELAQPERIRICDLVQNPLRLALLCSTWQTWEGHLPDTQAGLYQKFVQQFYIWKASIFNTDRQDELNQALGQLARRDIDESTSRFRLRESFIEKELGKVTDNNSLFFLALQLGWLNVVGVATEKPDEKVYAFYHPTFEEYFAALAVEDWLFFLNHRNPPLALSDQEGESANSLKAPLLKGGWGDLSYRLFEPQWKQVILLWLGREDLPKEHKEEFIYNLITFNDGCGDFYRYRSFCLAAAGIAEFRDCIYSKWIVTNLVDCATTHSDTDYIVGKIINPIFWDTLLENNRTIAINYLIDVLDRGFLDDEVRWKVFNCLIQIGRGNSKVIVALTKLMDTSLEYQEIAQEAAFFLRIIDPCNREAITFLEQQLNTMNLSNDLRVEAAYFLGKIDKGNLKAITFLTELIERNQGLGLDAASTLGKIDPGNPTAIKHLTKLLETERGDRVINISLLAACDLLKTDPENQDAIRVLRECIKPGNEPWDRLEAASALGKTQPGKQEAITVLYELRYESVKVTQEINFLKKVIDSLNQIEPRILPSPDWSPRTFLKEDDLEFLTRQLASIHEHLIKQNSIDVDDEILYIDNEILYEFMWIIAQNTAYPIFYKAWHKAWHKVWHQPEAKENEQSPIETTTSANTFTLKELPQRLHTALETKTQIGEIQDLPRLISIDANKFLDRENPATKIYNEMRRHGFPKSSNGTPQTLAQLQAYWDEQLIESNKPIVWLFYNSTPLPNTEPPTEDFSTTFLADLNKFDGAIAIITHQPNTPLKSFSPNQPNLVADMVAWICQLSF